MKQRANLRSPLFLQYASRPAEVESENLLLRSEELDNASWSKIRSTITNGVEAPDGTLTADKIKPTLDNNTHRCDQVITLTDDDTYTLSFFAKTSGYNCIRVSIGQASLTFGNVVSFNLSTKLITTTGDILDYGMVDYGKGWYRCYATMNAGTTDRLVVGIGIDDSYSFAGDTNSGVYFWGTQLENSSNMSSYIKTEGTTATRAATTTAQEEDVTAELRIYSGTHETDAPTEATYSLTKSPENAKTTFEVAELIRDYIEQTTTKSSGTVWADIKLSDNLQLEKQYHFLATEGYIDNTEGLQTYLNAPSNETFMQSNSTVLIPESQTLEIPVNAQYNSFYTITTGGVEGSAVYFSNLDDNSTQIEYITVSSTDEVIKLYVDSVVIEEINIQETECSKFADHLLMFVNKYGAKQDFYVNMKSTEKFKVKDDGFSRSVIDYNTLSVNNGIHSYKRRVLESKEFYSLNTPFLDEENVQAFEELLLSEYVWLKKEGADYIPVVIKNMSMTRRTHLNDKLIQYTVEVESANHLVNIQR